MAPRWRPNLHDDEDEDEDDDDDEDEDDDDHAEEDEAVKRGVRHHLADQPQPRARADVAEGQVGDAERVGGRDGDDVVRGAPAA